MKSQKAFSWVLSSLLVLSIGVASADVSDSCSTAKQIFPEYNLDEYIGNGIFSYDYDWYQVILPAQKMIHLTVHPATDLDVFIDFYADCGTFRSTKDLNYLGGAETISIYNSSNFDGIVYYRIWGKIGANDHSGTSSYNLQTSITDWRAPIAILSMNKMDYYKGDYFSIDALVWNITNQAKTVDLYLVLEFLGTFYFFPSGSQGVDGWFQQNVDPNGVAGLQDFIGFTIPNDFPILGPLTFYVAVYDHTTGLWSNVVWSTVYFR